MTPVTMKAIASVALSVRSLAMDGVQKANSGHPGLPMGCAELGSVIYGEILRHCPPEPRWINRDRFVLSAGHGSMFLYSLLHLSGYDVSLDDLKSFRQLGSRTPGHPEYGMTPGVETTTGPLGQGVANAVGFAIAEKMLAARFNTDKHTVIDHYTYVLASDGDLMEGVAFEAMSLAGHLGLGKLVLFYDSNRITIEGSTDLAFSDDVAGRFKSSGWHVQSGSAYDIGGIVRMAAEARRVTDKPSFILLESVIGKGSANLEGSHKTHGAPLGEEEVSATKKALGIPADERFYIHPEAIAYFREKGKVWKAAYEEWREVFDAWKSENPALFEEWKNYFEQRIPGHLPYPEFSVGEKLATRSAGGKVLNAIAPSIPNLIGGSADLAPSNNTELKGMGDFLRDQPLGRNMHFGIREHGMGGIVNGMALHGGIRPFCATFLIFSDYMRPSIRLAALMKLPVIYVFTHDSIFVGEDGPTHQPIEQITALRSIPNLLVLRPADAQETAAAWRMALERKNGPVAVLLTRQNLTVFEKHDAEWKDHIRRGAYIAMDSDGEPEIVIAASGSEVGLAITAAKKRSARKIRVVSMIAPSLFLEQDDAIRRSLLPDNARRLLIEAGIGMGWHGLSREGDRIVSIERFGESGPGNEVADHLGLTEETVCGHIDRL
ncbi:MAG: transketolase [Spirochaetales bacterium]|nr:transketolase [Spirochaetales bacterium]